MFVKPRPDIAFVVGISYQYCKLPDNIEHVLGYPKLCELSNTALLL